jgi:hypothetical protein
MSDPTDPPRKFYRLKPKEFERVNEIPGAAAGGPTGDASTGRTERATGDAVESAGPIDANGGAGAKAAGSDAETRTGAIAGDAAPRAAGAGTAGSGGVDVRDLVRFGSAGVPLLGSNQVRTTANEVHAMLAQNEAVAEAHGLNAVKPVRKFLRRKRDFWVMLVGGNLLIAVLYFGPNFVAFQVATLASRQVPDAGGYVMMVLRNPVLFAFPTAIAVFYSGLLVWLMFGLMEDY